VLSFAVKEVMSARTGSDSPPPDAESSGNIEEKRRPKKRKSVSWAPEESLRKVHTFVLDETERSIGIVIRILLHI
jgi:hypothetical protein